MKKGIVISVAVLIALGVLFSLPACKSSPTGPGGREWVEVEIRYNRVIPIQCPLCEDSVKLWFRVEKPDGQEYDSKSMLRVKKNVYKADLVVYYDKFNTINVEDLKLYEPTYTIGYGAVPYDVYVNGHKLLKYVDPGYLTFIVRTDGSVWQP